jgi:hypothetical protein
MYSLRAIVSLFGHTFTDLKDDILAAYICCASNMIQHSLNNMKPGPQFPFLSQATGVTGIAGYGLKETMMAWFPELCRLSPRFGRYARLGYGESAEKFNETLNYLKQHCACSTCNDNTSIPTEICKVTLAEVIVNLGLYVTRMIVSPKLYPKRSGVLAFYRRHHATRMARSVDALSTPSDDFIRSIANCLPSSVEMLKAGALLFANSGSVEIDAQANLMGITFSGLTIFLSSFKDIYDDPIAREQRKVSIIVSPGWMCLFGHEARLEVYEPAYIGWSFDQQWEEIRVGGKELRQIMKRKGRVMLSSLVSKDSKEEDRARVEGWTVLI